MSQDLNEIRVFAPATIANLSCGFDILGLALEGVGDVMHLKRTDSPGVRILAVHGMDLPLEATQNVAGVAALALLEASGFSGGVEMVIEKRIKPGSGIGSSAASAAGAAWGLNALLGYPFENPDLVRFAMEGERLASGTAHADNVAPAIYGGITLVRSTDPLDIARVHCPGELHACVLHPQVELKTSDARKILKTSIPMAKGIRQWGNVGGLVTGLFTEDYGLISRSLEDCIIEPVRSLLIPGFDTMKQAALETGALGFGISGSGPSVYALCRGSASARQVGQALQESYAPFDIPFELHLSPVGQRGVCLLEPDQQLPKV